MKQDGFYYILLLVCTLLVDSQAFLGPQHTTERATISGYHRNTSLEYRDVLLLLPRVVVQLFASSASSSSSSRDADQQAAIFSADEKSSDRDQQTWNDAEIVSSRPACPSGKSTLIEIQVDRETLREYTTPGQFVQLRPHNDDSIDPIFLAISSAPAFGKTSKSTLQFLIKMSPRLPWLPETLVKGTTVKISPVMGSGFPLNQLLSRADADASTIILAAAGSGIAPLKACIESGLLVQQRQQSNIQAILYYGEWTEEDLCFTDLYDGWKAEHGVDMKRVLSRAPDTQGYIQKVLSDDGLVQNADNAAAKSTWAILCGMDDMVESCTQVLRDAGVDEDRILLNL